MSRYDGLIIPRSYSEYINKTDAATLQQALQLPGVLSGAVAAGDNKAVKSSAVNAILQNKSYGGQITHNDKQYSKLTVIINNMYTTSIIALTERGASIALIGICANDEGEPNVRTYLKDVGSFGKGKFFYKPIGRASIELYWYTSAYSDVSNYQIITNTENTELTVDRVNSLPEGAIEL